MDRKPITVDFETDAIEDRPEYPPEPCGVSILLPGKKPKYYAWGHPTNNNCSKEDGGRALAAVWKDPAPKLFQNAKFDLEVALEAFRLPVLPWHLTHDTMYLLFLKNPHSKTLSLKPSAEEYLGEAPTERDELKEWIIVNVPEARQKPSTWGAYISRAPGDLVGKYANGDTSRTRGLFELLYPQILEAGMGKAYDRERRLMPMLLENERVGIRVDVPRLRKDLERMHTDVKTAEQWIFKRLKREFNIDSDAEKVEALDAAGIVTEWKRTPTGRKSTAKKNLTVEMFTDPRVASAIGYRDRLCTCIRMFGENWLEMAEKGDGHIHTNWNQVAQDRDGGKVGARTGRPSTSNPNVGNISKTWDDKDDGYVHPKFLDVLELPLMRRYMLPDKGEIFLHRDYSQQELRFAAHYEDGQLLRLFNTPTAELPPEFIKDGMLDIHNYISLEIKRIRHMDIARRPTKITVFRKIYGGGVPATAEALKIGYDEAKQIIAAVDHVVPGLKLLAKDLEKQAREGEPIITWGGRHYYVEPPSYSERFKRMMDYYYKLINYLIQGSSADGTKEATIRYHEHPKKRGRFLVSVYDECNVSAAIKAHRQEMAVLKEAMESLECDVPMLTTGKSGPNWAELKSYQD